MHKAARVFLIVVSVLNGFLGLVCGMLLIVRPDGGFMQMGALLPVIGTFPFASVFFRAAVAYLVVGVVSAFASLWLMRRPAGAVSA